MKDRAITYQNSQQNTRLLFLMFSILSLFIGISLYLLFRGNNLWIYRILGINGISLSIIPENKNILTNFIMFNLPDGLWILSGLLFLRFLWCHEESIFTKYRFVFIAIGIAFEFLQLFQIVPGTFDVFDMVTMVIFAFIEQIIYKFFTQEGGYQHG